ncbi:hypothetical protein Q1695_007742 [Nippostrongylus brasiliensis]|nr:hypothetical protein Q1695_007742 [Nippostrongylus brasiliensis]
MERMESKEEEEAQSIGSIPESPHSEQEAKSAKSPTPPTSRASKTFEEISEEYDDWDGNIHTYTGRRNRLGGIDGGRVYRKSRSKSFSEQPTRKLTGVEGSAKDRAILSRHMSSEEGSVSPLATSIPSLTNGKPDPDLYKAVNDYYNRHIGGASNDKQYDSLFGAPDYVLKKAALETNNNNDNNKPALTTRQFDRSIYWLVHNRRKYGFRHICMLLLVLSYTLLGAAMFFNIETNHEHKTVAEHKAALDKNVEAIAKQLMLWQNNTDVLITVENAEQFVKSAYVSLLKDESLYSISAYYKSKDPENYKWTFSSALFFSMNLYTTTGYGSIAPESTLGRSCAIWYSLITIPITLVVIRDLGQWALVHLTKIYANFLVRFRRTMGYIEPSEDSMISLPIKFCLLLLAGYLLFAAVFIYFFDQWLGDLQHSGLPFFDSFYFAYISISTIGLGDIMPNNATFHPIISALFFFGMPVMKVVNRATYVCIENGVFGAFTLLESSIDRFTTKIQPREEQPVRKVSRKLSRCSYCSHEVIDEDRDEAMELLNSLTIRSLATFARANADVYGGGFGRVNLRTGDLVQSRTNDGTQSPSTPA